MKFVAYHNTIRVYGEPSSSSSSASPIPLVFASSVFDDFNQRMMTTTDAIFSSPKIAAANKTPKRIQPKNADGWNSVQPNGNDARKCMRTCRALNTPKKQTKKKKKKLPTRTVIGRMTKAKYINERINSVAQARPLFISFYFRQFRTPFMGFFALLLLFGRKQFPFHFGCFCASASMHSLLFSFSFACVFCVHFWFVAFVVQFSLLLSASVCLSVCLSSTSSLLA